jgi:hypothetical protein
MNWFGRRGRTVTEAEWLACEDAEPMVALVGRKAGGRKLRLYFCKSARGVLHLLADARSRQAVEVAESYVDGGVTLGELDAAHTAACLAARAITGLPSMDEEQVRASAAAWHVALCAQAELDDDWTLGRGFWEPKEARARRCNWLRDIFGNPFRPATFDSGWRTSDVVALARGMYESRDFSAMPILADALMDAGCDNEDILAHCRSEGPHVRGCWVVDLILGKQ